MTARRFAHALVAGKFYPPHNGHMHLIALAAAFSGHVTVAVLGSSVESLSIADRVAWLRRDLAGRPGVRVQGILDDLPVDYADPDIWEGHVALMRQAISIADASDPFPPLDAVFSSEAYGYELGRRLGVYPVVLDPTRASVPVSGTAIRADVAGNWEALPSGTRAGLCLRLVVLGAESTGTTTLCRDLQAALKSKGGVWERTRWVAEYGREYSEALTAILRPANPRAMPQDAEWTEADFLHIASEQTQREAAAAEEGGPYLILDTDALATVVWHERYRGVRSEALEALAAGLPRRDLYVLTSPVGVAFEQDGLRDGEHLRLKMHEQFRERLERTDVAWMEVAGGREERVRQVLERLEGIAKAKWTFAAPIAERNKT